jgi:hypothetical protein
LSLTASTLPDMGAPRAMGVASVGVAPPAPPSRGSHRRHSTCIRRGVTAMRGGRARSPPVLTTREPRPPSSLPLSASKKKIYFENLKKISYQPRRNLLQPQIVKNLLPKWSVFVRIFYKNNSIFFLSTYSTLRKG